MTVSIYRLHLQLALLACRTPLNEIPNVRSLRNANFAFEKTQKALVTAFEEAQKALGTAFVKQAG